MALLRFHPVFSALAFSVIATTVLAQDRGLAETVEACWIVEGEAAQVTVTVALELDADGRVVGEVALVTASGGDQTAVEAAYLAARRAILRCQGPDGFDRTLVANAGSGGIEITFGPSGAGF